MEFGSNKSLFSIELQLSPSCTELYKLFESGSIMSFSEAMLLFWSKTVYTIKQTQFTNFDMFVQLHIIYIGNMTFK